MNKLTRRLLLAGGGVALTAAGVGGYLIKHPRPAPIGFDITPQELARARALPLPICRRAG